MDRKKLVEQLRLALLGIVHDGAGKEAASNMQSYLNNDDKTYDVALGETALRIAEDAIRAELATGLDATAARYEDPSDLQCVWGWGSIAKTLRRQAAAIRERSS